jgi:hypothetical protein
MDADERALLKFLTTAERARRKSTGRKAAA